MLDITSFGRWLKLRRIALELTQAELGRLVGCTEVTIRKIEADERRPSRELAQRLAVSLELALDERASFLKAARAELGVFRLPSPTHAAVAATPRGSVSRPRTPLIGREPELATVRVLLQDAGVGLVTLTGPGGIGKTRLALEIAANLQGEFRDGGWFVDLAPLRDPALVASSIASVLGLQEQRGQPVAALLRAYLSDKQLLLVLDNFEHLVPAAPLVAELLAGAPGLTVLVTSRAALHLRGEREVTVPPLTLPDVEPRPSPERLMQSEAVRLFVACARNHNAGFQVTDATAPAVAEICRRLDGLPLAIELAAARIRVLTPQGLLARLERRLSLLTGGLRDLPARQQTIRATIAWSYDLLEPAAQELLTRLGVFAGGCTLEAIEVVSVAEDGLPDEMLDSVLALVNNSLLRQEPGPGDEPRFVMLETVREFALERLEASGEADRLRRRYAEHYLRVAEAAEHDLEQHTGHFMWFERLEVEHDNLRAALQWALDQQEPIMALRLATALKDFWRARGYVAEGSRWLEAALAASADAAVAPALRAKALLAAGLLVWRNLRRRDALFGESLAVFQELGDSAGIAAVLGWRGMTAKALGEYPKAVALFEEQLALERARGSRQGIAQALLGLGWMAHDTGDFGRAFTLLEESLALQRELDNQPAIAFGLFALGVAAYQLGDFPRATGWLEASRTLFEALGEKGWLASVIAHLGSSAASQGEVEQSARLLDEALVLMHASGLTGSIAGIRRFQGKAALQLRDWPRARAALQESLRLRPGVGGLWEIAACLEGLAAVADGQDQSARAARLAGAAAALREQLGAPVSPGDRYWYEPAIAHARAALGDAGFMAAQAEGRAMTLEQAIAFALETGG